MNRNYSKETDSIINNILTSDYRPSLLLHSCCAPCSSYVLEYLSAAFRITVFYYNPNIFPEEEFDRRVSEQKRFISQFCRDTDASVEFADAPYDCESFYAAVKGFEDVSEGDERCFRCYRLRLEKTAAYAAEHGFDYFTTTLSISPMKNAPKLNEISEELSRIYSVKALPSDFKKKNGFLRSTELSRKYSLYRQDYCGCVFSRKERDLRKEQQG